MLFKILVFYFKVNSLNLYIYFNMQGNTLNPVQKVYKKIFYFYIKQIYFIYFEFYFHCACLQIQLVGNNRLKRCCDKEK